MSREDFSKEYSTTQLATLRKKSASDIESRLDITERILKPKTLADVANTDALNMLQSALLAGAESRFNLPRSPYTVKTDMAAVLVLLNWAECMERLSRMPKVKKIHVAKLRHMKGRPINLEEFERMLAVTKDEVGDEAADSWESDLRMDELMHVSWDNVNEILPICRRVGCSCWQSRTTGKRTSPRNRFHCCQDSRLSCWNPQ